MKHTILCVDDEVDNVEALERLFRRKYTVLKATSGDEALEILKEHNPTVILSDQKMPKMTGTKFLKKSIKTHPNAIRILLTGYTDIESVIDAINSGEVYRYITKPWETTDLLSTVGHAIDKFNLNKELEEKNAALKTALTELKSLDKAKNDFMYLVNHELKTPLTVIHSYLQLIKESKLDEEQNQFINRIETSTQKLSSLIHEVLTIVSAETGQIKVNKRRTSITKIFDGIEVPFIEKAKAKKAKINLELEDAILNADIDILRDILSRLLDNAVKFCKDGSAINIQTKQSDSEVKFIVSNGGSELSKAKITKLLKPFTLDEDFMNHTTGFGLGLSICQALLKTHKSELHIESKNKQVTVSFTITK